MPRAPIWCRCFLTSAPDLPLRHSSLRLSGIERSPISAHLIFHHADRELVDDFVDRFTHLFGAVGQRGVNAGDDFVSSPEDDLIIQSIRHRYMADVSLAIVLLGRSTWSRRFVDWEIAAAIGMTDDDPLPLLVCDLDPRARAQIPLPPRLTLGGPTSASRIDTHVSPTVLQEAIDQALKSVPALAHKRHSLSDPLLRHDLR